MTDTNQKQLGNTLWSIADQLRGAMDADDFRDYMLSFLFLRYLSDNYETAAKKELGKDYPDVGGDARKVPLALWYANNVDDIPAFEKQMFLARRLYSNSQSVTVDIKRVLEFIPVCSVQSRAVADKRSGSPSHQ
jgi:hypothetical protein